jgi:hypothetical protein
MCLVQLRQVLRAGPYLLLGDWYPYMKRAGTGREEESEMALCPTCLGMPGAAESGGDNEGPLPEPQEGASTDGTLSLTSQPLEQWE